MYMKRVQSKQTGGHGGSRNADAYFISERCAEILVSNFQKNLLILIQQ